MGRFDTLVALTSSLLIKSLFQHAPKQPNDGDSRAGYRVPPEFVGDSVLFPGGILRGPSASEHCHTSVPAPAKVSALSHMGFSHSRGVLRPQYKTLHGPLRYQRSSACFRPVCLSLFCRSDWLAIRLPALLSPPRPPPFFVDSLDSELWYRF